MHWAAPVEMGRVLLALGTLLALIQPHSARAKDTQCRWNHEGGAHECAAAGFAFIGDFGDSGGNARIGANGGACGYADRYRYAKRRIDPGFLRLMEPRILERPRAAAIGSRPGEEQVAPAHRAASRRGRHQATSRRLHQSDLEALGGGGREEGWRDFVGRQGLSDPAQPMLARAGALRLHKLWNAAAPAAGQGHDPLALRPSIPTSALERVTPRAGNAI